jgi:hypothetical protein
MTTDKFCFYLQNRLIQTSQTGGQWYSDTSPLVFPAATISTRPCTNVRVTLVVHGHHFPLTIEHFLFWFVFA